LHALFEQRENIRPFQGIAASGTMRGSPKAGLGRQFETTCDSRSRRHGSAHMPDRKPG
jgi:hypothetical protein